VVSVETPYFGPSNTLFGIEAAARDHEHRVAFVSLRHVDAGELRASLDQLHESHVDGCIVIAPSRDAVDALPVESPSDPLVVMCGDELAGRSTVAVDQQTGARQATRHLISMGHRTIHHVRGPSGWLDADARESGWLAELRAHGLRAPRPRVGDWSARSGYEIGRRLSVDPDVRALFVGNDQMALGVLLAFAEAGRPAPEHVSVVGFDDVPESEFFAPPLTTVRQDFAELGRLAVERLVDLIAGDSGDHHIAVAPKLIVRRSTAPA
jgi:DNA-binding LacI/PurR family transcriptional regulator